MICCAPDCARLAEGGGVLLGVVCSLASSGDCDGRAFICELSDTLIVS